MNIKGQVFKEFIKNGYSRIDGNKAWNIAQRRFLYCTPQLVEGFLKLRSFPVYKKQIIDREISLIRSSIDKISENLGDESFNLVDIFCGDGLKAKEFIRMLNSKSNIRYCPLSVSSELVNLAKNKVEAENFSSVKDYESCVCDLTEKSLKKFLGNIRNSNYQRNVVLLLGSVLAGYQINDFLYQVSEMMLPGDYLIIGNGVRKGKRLVSLETYKHQIFNEWLINLVREVGFKDQEVDYIARFGNSRVEMIYKVNTEKSLIHGNNRVKFKKGDEIIAAILYKYFPSELEKFCNMYFDKVDLMMDKDSEYALVICRK